MTDSDEVKLLPCVTKASLQFADGTKLSIDFKDRKTIDEALSELRSAATEDTRPPVVTDEVVERVMAAICWAAAEHGIASEQTARAALASMPAVVSGGQT